MTRYSVERADCVGEQTVCFYADPVEALLERDQLRRSYLKGKPQGYRPRVLYRVLDRDSIDPPQSGEMEWCENCKRTAILDNGGDEWCESCEAGHIITRYFSFGMGQAHHLMGITYDPDCLVEITAEDPRAVMADAFGNKWGFEYDEPPDPAYYPRGIFKFPPER